MADLTKDRAYRLGPGPHHIRKCALDTSAAQTVYMSQPLFIDGSEDTINLRGYVDAIVVATTTDRFVGICASAQTSVLIGATETDCYVDVITWGLVGFPTATCTAADVGELATFSDSATVVAGDAAGATRIEAGYVAYVEDGFVYVMINGKTGGAPVLCA